MNAKKAKAVRMQLRSEGIDTKEGQLGTPYPSTVTVMMHNRVPAEKRKPGRPSGVRPVQFSCTRQEPGAMRRGCGRKVYQTLKTAVTRGAVSLPPLAWYHEQRELQAMDDGRPAMAA